MNIRNRILAAATIAGLAFGLALPTFAHGPGQGAAGPGYGWSWGYGGCPGMMGQGMDPGMMMGPGMMGQGMGPGMMGQGMGPGMMGQGMGPGMMGQGMGPGMMGQGMGPSYGMTGPGMMQPLAQDLSAAEVQHMLEHRLAWERNPNLKVGKVEEKDLDAIVAEVVTQDGSLVQRLEVDRHTGWMKPAQ